jgi:hypothetical protein
MARGVRQIGLVLATFGSALENAGLGPTYVNGPDTGLLLYPPTDCLASDEIQKDVVIGGRIQFLMHLS